MLNIDTTSRDSVIESFNRIAKDLILNKAISVNGYLFSLIDIEFYYKHEIHPDGYTMDHYRPTGELEIHRFGIDISLGTKDENGYGGILICGLYDLQKNLLIQKPQVIKELFNRIKIGDNQLMILDHNSPWTDVFRAKRQNLGNPGGDRDKLDFVDSLYKYFAKDERILKGYKGKEAILKSSDLTEEEILELVKYKLTK